MKHSLLVPIIYLKVTLIFIIITFISNKATAQLPCFDVTNVCVGGSDPAVWDSYQCIQGPVNASTLLGNLLKSQSDATFMQQRIVISGTLTIDIPRSSGGYSFVNGSSIILTGAASEIVINPGCQLTLDNSVASGCFSMWKNILVSDGGSLVVKNGCYINDGINAIRAFPLSAISITDNTFRANYAAITIGSDMTNQQIPFNYFPNGGIWGNEIIGGSLKAPYAGEESLLGIQIGNVSSILIGNTGHGPNIISNLKNTFNAANSNGISAANSNVTIHNTKFTNIGLPGADEDAAIGGFDRSMITLLGLGSAINTIEAGNVGVYLHNSGAEISNSKFKDNSRGVVHESNDTGPLNNLEISECIFEGFDDSGVAVSESCRLSIFEVTNCKFDDNRELPENRVYISVTPIGLKDGVGFKFSGNKFYFRNRAVPGNVNAIGILLTSLYRGLGIDNEFYDEGTHSGLNRTFIGVNMDGCNTVLWKSNDFLGSGGTSNGYYSETGIIASNSPFCQYNCNLLDGFNTGMRFSGDCGTSILYNNSFNAHSRYGLELAENGTVIGGQFKKYNEWNSSGSFKQYTGYNPLNATHQFQVRRSLFTIHIENVNLPAWPNPRKVDVIDPDNIWFVGQNTWPPLVNLCPLISKDPYEPNLDFGEQALVTGNFIPFGGYAANTWDAALLLYQHMTDDPTIRPYGSAEETWYFNNYNTSIGKFRRVYDGYISLFSGASLFTSTQLLSDLNAISVTTTHEINLKTGLRIFLERYISNSESYTPQQVSEFTAIANQCRYEGGIGVVLARLALGQSSVRSEDCSNNFTGGQGNTSSVQTIANAVNVSILPNPAEQSFTIHLDRGIENGNVRLIDLQGRVLGNWAISGTSLNISEINVTPGLYVLEVLEKGSSVSRTKLAFSH